MDFKSTIQKIKNEYDIVDYIKSNGVNLELSTNNSWKGLCPFHNEKTPSFVVREDFQSYHCFGCGENGDILTFAQKNHTVSFFEALKMLAEEKGIEIEGAKNDEPQHDISGIRKVVQDAYEFYAENYRKLDISHPAKQQVISRNLNVNSEIYGYSLEKPNELYKYLKSKGHSDKNIQDSNLVIFYEGRQPWDFFHGRLMIVLSDYLGRPISFTSRKIFEDDKMQGKYVNGKESPVFSKKMNLFGADTAKKEARKQKKIYVVEGQFDKIAMEENGIENVVATSGTAFTAEHANLLMRMVGPSGEIIFILDGDEAGTKAAVKIFTSFKSIHSNAYAVHLSNGKDPCDYIVEGGVESLRAAVERSTTLHDFVIQSIINKMGGNININNRQKFVSEVSSYAKCTDESYIIESMLNKASIMSAISIDNIKEIYHKTGSASTNSPESKPKKENKEEEVVVVDTTSNDSTPKEVEKPRIRLNQESEADHCMFTALALLVRLPDELLVETPDLVHNKFKSFLREVKEKHEEYKSKNMKWRFIVEDYEDSIFAKALQSKVFLSDPSEDLKSTTSQYVYLFNRANEVYKKEYEEMKKAKALSSIADTTDPKKIAEALKLYMEHSSDLA